MISFRCMLASALVVCLSAFATPEGRRYVVAYSVAVDGVETAAGEVAMAENGKARIERSYEHGGYAFDASLNSDGARLTLETAVWRNGSKIAEPVLTLTPGGSARISSGDDRRKVTVHINPEP